MRNWAPTIAAFSLLIASCSGDDDGGMPSTPSARSDTTVEENQPATGGDEGGGAAEGDGASGAADEADDSAMGSGDTNGTEGANDDLSLSGGEDEAPGGGGGEDTGADDPADVMPGGDDQESAVDDPGDPEEEPASDEPDEEEPAPDDILADGTMTFFVTSAGMGDGGNLGGLDGADAFCADLAAAASPDLSRRTWRAYLSTSTVDARDRIGTGPWHNQAGAVIANSLDELHDAANVDPGGPLDAAWPIGNLEIALDETGAQVPGNVHDILTGTLLDGTAAPGLNCDDWTSNSQNATARNGHSNRTGLAGQRQLFNDVHDVGCGPVPAGSNFVGGTVSQGGGRGSIYCFAVITGE